MITAPAALLLSIIYTKYQGQIILLKINGKSLIGLLLLMLIISAKFYVNLTKTSSSLIEKLQHMVLKCPGQITCNEKNRQDGPVSLSWLPDKFRVNRAFGSKKFNIDFQDGNHLGFQPEPFSYFWSTNEVSSQLAFWFRGKKSKKIFNMAARATILGFWLEWFSYFWSMSPSLPTPPILPIKCQLAYLFRRS